MIVTRCRSCRTPVVWLKTLAHKSILVDADFMSRLVGLEADAPVFEHKVHADGVHWRSCPFADEHRKGR